MRYTPNGQQSTRQPFATARPRVTCCDYCGQEYGPAPAGVQNGRMHLREDGSGQRDEEQDTDHWPRHESDTHEED